ncbi:MAG: hypothetical protein LBT50_06865 [Prevotellaceae bacterium]|jgi:hypothetical protein|nr:hypothetical protein [Prevotellaceae bacterium]
MGNLEKSNKNMGFIEQVEIFFNRRKLKFDPTKFRDAASHEKCDTRLVRGSVNLIERRFFTKEDVDIMVDELLKLKLE